MGVSQFCRLLLILAVVVPGNSVAEIVVDGKSLFEIVTDKARSLSEEEWAGTGNGAIPEVLDQLSYEQYRDIRFEKDHALWRDESKFQVEMFHPGFLYDQPVVLNEVDDGRINTVPYDTGMFDYGDNDIRTDQLGADLGFAGFRIHFPVNRKEYFDEVIAFLGASYFRMVGGGQVYGLSARGLAVDTALPEGEEFPRFSEYWLVRPKPQAISMTFYALLESRSVVGAYRFVLTPGISTELEVETRLFARRNIGKLGVVPLTSMFMFGENSVTYHDDYRPEVHDSDGLLMRTKADEWIWRPLTNGKSLQVSSFVDDEPRGFGLVQRDREFGHYLDAESRYPSRPSIWVDFLGGDWGKGAVELIEIPSEEETNDNIVAYWVPDGPFDAGHEFVFKYRLRTFGGQIDDEQVATVTRTRIGWGAIPGSQEKPPRSLRQFIVDFSGADVHKLDRSQPVVPELSTTSGEVRDLMAIRLPEDYGWRVAFKLAPHESKPADMRLYLTLHGKRLSETWNYIWRPEMTP